MSGDALWTGLARMPSAAGLPDDWRWAFEDEFENARPFLRPTVEHDQCVPCRRRPPCACRHAVVEGRHELVAVCACEPCDCAPFRIEMADTLVYRLAWDQLGPAIGEALELGPTRAKEAGAFRDPALIEIGVWGRRRLPVFVSLASSQKTWRALQSVTPTFLSATGPARSRQTRSALQLLQDSCSRGFVLLTPVERTAKPEWRELITGLGGVEVPLSRLLRFLPHRRFKAVDSLDSVLRSWRPPPAALEAEALALVRYELKALRGELQVGPRASEPLPDDVAGQLFASIQNLESHNRWRKAPVLQVFRLYCLEGLPAEQVAKRCGCAKSLVVERLRQLRQKLGRNPAELRAYSSQFERLEDALSDSRARRIYRPSALDEPEDEEEGE